jgi:hypothetical protein
VNNIHALTSSSSASVRGFKKEGGASEGRGGSDLLPDFSGKYYFWGSETEMKSEIFTTRKNIKKQITHERIGKQGFQGNCAGFYRL